MKVVYHIDFFIVNNMAGNKKYIPYLFSILPMGRSRLPIDTVAKLIDHMKYIDPDIFPPDSMLSYNGHMMNDVDVRTMINNTWENIYRDRKGYGGRMRGNRYRDDEPQIIILYNVPHNPPDTNL